MIYWTILALTLHLIHSTKFDYISQKHEYFCFQQNIEKQSRYQLIVKANQTTFSIQVFQEELSVFQDNRSDVYIKQYSAFSKINGIAMICLGNKNYDSNLKFQIEFYHGLHLDGSSMFQPDSFTQIQQLFSQTAQTQELVKNSYEINVNTLTKMNQIISSAQFATFTASLVFLVSLTLSRVILISKLKKMFKNRKII